METWTQKIARKLQIKGRADAWCCGFLCGTVFIGLFALFLYYVA